MRANQGLRLRSLRANKISLNSLLKNRASFKSSDFDILTERQAEKTKNREKVSFFMSLWSGPTIFIGNQDIIYINSLRSYQYFKVLLYLQRLYFSVAPTKLSTSCC